MRVLVVEDHEELAAAVATGLRREGMAVDVAPDGAVALQFAAIHGYDVIVLDRDLPEVHGDQVCQVLVERGARARVLMLTASAGIEDRVSGLSLGADDYLPKPFAFAELVARIRALARRAQPALPPVMRRGELTLDPAQRVAHRGGRRLDLSLKELAVLELLLAADRPRDRRGARGRAERGASHRRWARGDRRLSARRAGRARAGGLS